METGTGVNNTVVSVDNSDGKRQKCSGIELEDRLGNLPDSILVHILSFLLTRDAVKTVLISRFAMHSFFMQGLQFINSASTLRLLLVETGMNMSIRRSKMMKSI